MRHSRFLRAALVSCILWPAPLLADSKLLGTAGASEVEGQGGGGIVPWAVISGYGDSGEWGGAAAYTRLSLDDLQLDVAAVSVGISNRVELSYGRQRLRVQPLGLTIGQDVFAGKIRLGGDLIYGAIPQISAGVQYKRNRDFEVPSALGANSDSGVDYYLATSRLWLNGLLGRNVFANATLRWTEANQMGLLGFGADGRSDYRLEAEATVGIFFNRYWAAGFEYRQMPDRLGGVREQDWQDVWIGWFPNKHFSSLIAYADLGDVAGLKNQRGWYLSIQLNQ